VQDKTVQIEEIYSILTFEVCGNLYIVEEGMVKNF